MGAKGNDGIAQQIKDTPGAIGYVELIYALQQKLTYAELKNAEGQYVKASPQSVTAALATAKIPEDFRFLDGQRPGQDFLPDLRRDLDARVRGTGRQREGQEAGRLLEVGANQRRKARSDLGVRPAAREAVQKQVLARIETIKVK